MATLEELRALFTGVPDRDGWSSTPCYDVGLATEIARQASASSEVALREVLFDDTSPDEIPARALEVIQLAYARWRSVRQLQTAGRGLR